MRRLFLWAGLLGVLAVPACSQLSVRERHDPNTDFSRLHTWAWHPRGDEPWDRRLARDRLDIRIEEAVEKDLSAKGYRQVDTDPDFRVNYQVAVGARQAVQANPNTYGYAIGPWDLGVYSYDEGTLFIDVIDARANALLWRGAVSAVARPGLSLEARQERFTKAAEKVMAQFPPH